MAPDPVTDAFSASEEAFFHSVPPPNDAPTSERPVTLEQELFVTEPAQSSEREWQRARFMRPVSMTLGVLGFLTLIGLARHATLVELNERALAQAAASSPVHAVSAAGAILTDVAERDGTASAATTTPSDEASALMPPQQLAVETALEDPPELLMSPADAKTPPDPDASQPSEGAPVAENVAPSGANRATQALEHLPSGPHVASTEARRARKVTLGSPVPISKSALLSAIRASRPAHANAPKTR